MDNNTTEASQKTTAPAEKPPESSPMLERIREKAKGLPDDIARYENIFRQSAHWITQDHPTIGFQNDIFPYQSVRRIQDDSDPNKQKISIRTNPSAGILIQMSQDPAEDIIEIEQEVKSRGPKKYIRVKLSQKKDTGNSPIELVESGTILKDRYRDDEYHPSSEPGFEIKPAQLEEVLDATNQVLKPIVTGENSRLREAAQKTIQYVYRYQQQELKMKGLSTAATADLIYYLDQLGIIDTQLSLANASSLGITADSLPNITEMLNRLHEWNGDEQLAFYRERIGEIKEILARRKKAEAELANLPLEQYVPLLSEAEAVVNYGDSMTQKEREQYEDGVLAKDIGSSPNVLSGKPEAFIKGYGDRLLESLEEDSSYALLEDQTDVPEEYRERIRKKEAEHEERPLIDLHRYFEIQTEYYRREMEMYKAVKAEPGMEAVNWEQNYLESKRLRDARVGDWSGFAKERWDQAIAYAEGMNNNGTYTEEQRERAQLMISRWRTIHTMTLIDKYKDKKFDHSKIDPAIEELRDMDHEIDEINKQNPHSKYAEQIRNNLIPWSK